MEHSTCEPNRHLLRSGHQATALTANRVYYYRFSATNAAGRSWAQSSSHFLAGNVWIVATDPNASEDGDTGTFAIRRSTSATNGPITVNFSFESGSTASASDYNLSTNGSITIPTGTNEVTITLTPVLDGDNTEGSETLTLQIDAGEYVIGTPPSATVTIADHSVNTYYDKADGNWLSTATWESSPGLADDAGPPAVGDIGLIDSHTVTVTAADQIANRDAQVRSGGTLYSADGANRFRYADILLEGGTVGIDLAGGNADRDMGGNFYAVSNSIVRVQEDSLRDHTVTFDSLIWNAAGTPSVQLESGKAAGNENRLSFPLVTISQNGTLIITNEARGRFGPMTGSATLTKTGPGRLYLDGNSPSFDGGLIINAGTVQATVGDTGAATIGTGTATINNGGELYASEVSYAFRYGRIIVNSGGTLHVYRDGGDQYELDNAFVDLYGGLLRLRCDDAADFRGDVTVKADSTIRLDGIDNSGGATYINTLTFDPGPFTLIVDDNSDNSNHDLRISNPVQIYNAATLQVNDDVYFDGATAGGATLTKTAAGRLYLNNTSPGFTGHILVNGGTLYGAAATCIGPGTVTVTNGLAQPVAADAFSGGIIIVYDKIRADQGEGDDNLLRGATIRLQAGGVFEYDCDGEPRTQDGDFVLEGHATFDMRNEEDSQDNTTYFDSLSIAGPYTVTFTRDGGDAGHDPRIRFSNRSTWTNGATIDLTTNFYGNGNNAPGVYLDGGLTLLGGTVTKTGPRELRIGGDNSSQLLGNINFIQGSNYFQSAYAAGRGTHTVTNATLWSIAANALNGSTSIVYSTIRGDQGNGDQNLFTGGNVYLRGGKLLYDTDSHTRTQNGSFFVESGGATFDIRNNSDDADNNVTFGKLDITGPYTVSFIRGGGSVNYDAEIFFNTRSTWANGAVLDLDFTGNGGTRRVQFTGGVTITNGATVTKGGPRELEIGGNNSSYLYGTLVVTQGTIQINAAYALGSGTGRCDTGGRIMANPNAANWLQNATIVLNGGEYEHRNDDETLTINGTFIVNDDSSFDHINENDATPHTTSFGTLDFGAPGKTLHVQCSNSNGTQTARFVYPVFTESGTISNSANANVELDYCGIYAGKTVSKRGAATLIMDSDLSVLLWGSSGFFTTTNFTLVDRTEGTLTKSHFLLTADSLWSENTSDGNKIVVDMVNDKGTLSAYGTGEVSFASEDAGFITITGLIASVTNVMEIDLADFSIGNISNVATELAENTNFFDVTIEDADTLYVSMISAAGGTNYFIWDDVVNSLGASVTRCRLPLINNADGATNITAGSAYLNGRLFTTLGQNTGVFVYWGLTNGGTTASAWANTNEWTAPQSPGLFSHQAASLTQNRTYYYRFSATNSYGRFWAPTVEAFVTAAVTIDATDAWAAENTDDTGAITIERSTITNGELIVYYSIGGTAQNGVDYTNLSGIVTIPDGSSNVVLTIDPAQDAFSETGETVIVTLLPGNYAIGMPNAATVTIADLTIEVTNLPVTVVSGNNALLEGHLISAGGGPNPNVYVCWGTNDFGTNSTTDWEFVESLGTDWGQGDTFSTNVTVPADNLYYFRCYVTNASGDAWATNVQTFMRAGLQVIPWVTPVTESGGTSATFNIYRPVAATNGDLIVHYTVSGTATPDVDYTPALSGLVTIQDGDTNVIISITPIEDLLFEDDETVRIDLTPDSYNIGANSNATVTITEDDHEPSDSLYRMKIYFSGYTKVETLVNFPALVLLGTNLTSKGFSYTQFESRANAGDLRFADYTETYILPYEIEEWNTNGQSYVWVRVPELAGTNTFVWAYWGNTNWTTPPPYTTNGLTWSEGYEAVWHMVETGTGNRLDSTTNNYHAVPQQYDGDEATSAGLVSGADILDGTDDYLAITGRNYTAAGEIGSIFVSGWVKSSSTNQQIMASFDRNEYWRLSLNDDSGVGVAWDTTDSTTAIDDFRPGNQYTNGAWHYIGGWFDAGNSGDDKKLYVDGEELVGTNGHGGLSLGSGVNTRYGFLGVGSKASSFNSATGPVYYLKGTLDETRISRVARSADWIWAEWMNMASNNVFCS